jgi:hypothetical protein
MSKLGGICGGAAATAGAAAAWPGVATAVMAAALVVASILGAWTLGAWTLGAWTPGAWTVEAWTVEAWTVEAWTAGLAGGAPIAPGAETGLGAAGVAVLDRKLSRKNMPTLPVTISASSASTRPRRTVGR